MWSEHCSYKSSRIHLRRLPTEAPHVLVGPGENAGVIDAGDGIAVAIRIESHNHPSAIEPYQGAATGVGGILRDIFTMGARPIAVMDPLFFGDPDDARQRWLIEGVVAGISGYGNSVGRAHRRRRAHLRPLLRPEPAGQRAVPGGAARPTGWSSGRPRARATWPCCWARRTGRDGIGGVSVLASAGFGGTERRGDAEAAKRPSVQVGDPFEEKRLIEACLELLDAKLVVGIQDLGGAGLVCATSETAARGGVGMDVDVSAVPRREPGMAAFEVMTSESQERMLAIVTPGDLARVEEVCRRWEVRAAVVGRVTEPPPGEPGRLRILDGFDGEVLADVPAVALSEDAPLYHRPLARPGRPRGPRRPTTPAPSPPPADCGADVLRPAGRPVLGLPPVRPPAVPQHGGRPGRRRRRAPPGRPRASRRRSGAWPSPPTPTRPGAPRSPGRHGGHRGRGGPQRGLCRGPAGGRGQLPQLRQPRAPRGHVAAVRGHRRHEPRPAWPSGLPVIGGNVSLYNESGGTDIDPTPVIGVLGLIDQLAARPPGVTLVEEASLVLLDASVGPSAAGGAPVAGRVALGRRVPGPPQRHAARPRPGRPRPAGGVRRRAGGRRRVAGPAGDGSWWPASTTCRAAGWGWPWPRWRSARASGCRWPASPTTTSCSPRPRPGWWCAPTRHDELISRAAERRGRASGCSGTPGATGWWSTAWSTSAVAEATAAWRDRLPALLDELAPAVALIRTRVGLDRRRRARSSPTQAATGAGLPGARAPGRAP